MPHTPFLQFRDTHFRGKLGVALLTLIAVTGLMSWLIPAPKESLAGMMGVNATILEIDKDNQTITVQDMDSLSPLGKRCLLTWDDPPFITLTADQEPIFISIDTFTVGDTVVISITDVQKSTPTKATATTIQLVT